MWKLTTLFTSFITIPNVSDSLLRFKCSPSHSVMAAIGQTKTFLPYLLALDSAHLLYACALSRTPAIESTHFSPSHRVLKYTSVGGNSSVLNIICPTSSYTRQYVPFYKVQSRAQTDTFILPFFELVFLGHRMAATELWGLENVWEINLDQETGIDKKIVNWQLQWNIETLSRNHSCHGKAIRTTYSECVSVVLVIQHATRIRRSVLSSVACPALPYSSTRHDFWKMIYWT
jgi:hypothetical protein